MVRGKVKSVIPFIPFVICFLRNAVKLADAFNGILFTLDQAIPAKPEGF